MVPRQKFLIIRLSSFGDIVLATPIIPCIKKHFPQASIDFVTYQHFSEVIRFHPDIDTVYSFDKKRCIALLKSRKFFLAVRLWRSFLKTLQSKYYDYIIDLHSVTDSAIIGLHARGAVRICNSQQLLSLFFSKRYHFPLNNEAGSSHAVSYNLSSLHALGIFPDPLDDIPAPQFFPPEESRQRAERICATINPKHKPLVGINPQASRSFKCWDKKNFAALIDMIYEKFDVMIVLTGNDQTLLSEIHDLAKIKPSVLPKSDTLLAFTLITKFDFFITNDSGPMHIAATHDVPQLAIFGHSNRIKFSPWSRTAVLITNSVPCSPCSEKRAQACPTLLCLSGITSKKVFTEFCLLFQQHSNSEAFQKCLP